MESYDSQLMPPPDPGDPPRRDQYLFLLEFFIHSITSQQLSTLNEMFYAPTSVTLNLLNLQDNSIVITPVDSMFVPLSGIPGSVENFFSGRSILFAIPEKMVTKQSTELKINLKVEKLISDGIHPDILVGSGELDLSTEFAALRKEVLQCWHRDCPPPKIFDGTIDLFQEEESSGIVSVLVKISGFGQCIITEFESPPEETATSFIFRGDERDDKALSYKCKIIDRTEVNICEELDEDSQSYGANLPKKRPCLPCGQPDAAKEGDQKQLQNCELSKMEGREMIMSSRGSPVPCGRAVVLKVSGLLDYDGKKKPTVTVGPESSKPDPEYDIFVLRIGKKGLVGADEKSDLQLEMKTPKGPERRPPIRYETREAQTEVEAKETKKKGKGKGKGKKKKK